MRANSIGFQFYKIWKDPGHVEFLPICFLCTDAYKKRRKTKAQAMAPRLPSRTVKSCRIHQLDSKGIDFIDF
jgi:hypothetical protein